MSRTQADASHQRGLSSRQGDSSLEQQGQASEEWQMRNREVEALLCDFVSSILCEKPADVFSFARDYFHGETIRHTKSATRSTPIAAVADDSSGEA